MSKPLTNKKGEVKTLTKKDIQSMGTASEILPESLLNVLPKRKRGERGTQKEPTKIPVTVRYSSEVISYFKKTGEGWQTRMNSVLHSYVKKHQK